MGRPERPVDPLAGPVERLAWELRRLRERAGRPSYRELAQRAHFSRSTLAEVATGMRLPTLEATLAYAVACGGERAHWEQRWREAAAEMEQSQRRCPYPGLAPLGTEDADLFFGRTELVGELLEAVRKVPLTAVFGASGSGKSSLLLAGLLPALTTDGVATAVMTPGAHPLGPFTEALGSLGTGERAVLVIDQFEEVFTLCTDETERVEFLDAVTGLAETPGDRPALVIGVRTDFYGHCAQHAGLVAALRRNVHLPIGPVSEDELRDIIVEPAARVGLTVEPVLVATVVAEAAGEPGALPLVAHALRETWSRVDGDVLRLADYQGTGGVREAIAQTAERLWEEFDEPQRDTVRRTFLRLTALGEGTDDTRRRMDRDELTGIGDPGEIDAVLDRLAAARLIVIDHGTVDVAHEALIAAWPRLREWLSTDRQDLLVHQSLTGAAIEWNRHDRSAEFLYRGSRLAAWADRDTAPLNELEQAFLSASRTQEAAERTAARRRIRLGIGGLGLTAAVVAVLAVLALVQADQTADERDRAFSRQLAANARAQLQRDPELALLLATKAYEAQRTHEADTVLRQTILDSRLRRTTSTGQKDIRGAAFSPDGHKAVTWAAREVVTWAWDGQRLSRRAPERVRDSKAVQGPAVATYGPGGKLLAVGNLDGTVEVWDLPGTTGQKIFRGPPGNAASSVAFNGAGDRLASTHGSEVKIWDLAGRRKPVTIRAGHGSGRLAGVGFSPDGKHIATGGGGHPAQIWDVSGQRPRLMLTGRQEVVWELGFSPDGQRLAAVTSDSTDVYRTPAFPMGTEEPVAELHGHDDTVAGLAFHPGDGRMATYDRGGTIRIWAAESARSPLVLRSPGDEMRGIAFSPDGRWLTSLSRDGTVRAWNVTVGGPGGSVTLQGRPDGESLRVLSADGRKIASIDTLDSTIRIWETGLAGPPTTLQSPRKSNRELALSHDGRQVAGPGTAGTLHLWNLGGESRPRVLREQSNGVSRVRFSPDGRRVAAAGYDNVVRVWETTGRETPVAVLRGYSGLASSLGFSPDGRRLAAALLDGTIVLRDVAGKEKPILLRGHTGVTDVEFSPDGRHLAGGGIDGTIRVWRTMGTYAPTAVLRGHQGSVHDLAFSPDSGWLASIAQFDGILRLWRTSGGAEPVLVSGFGTWITNIAFSADGRRLTTAHGDKPVRDWQCEVCGPGSEVLRLARQRATRTFTPEERRIYLKAP